MKYFYILMLLFSLICLFLAVSNSLPSWLAAIYAICFVGMIIKRMKKLVSLSKHTRLKK